MSTIVPPSHVPTGGTKPTRWLVHAIPNAIIFSLLIAVLYAGHHTGWKLPRLSVLLGHGKAAADDWCSEHLVPESICIECNHDLLPQGKPFGFCREHGVAECVIDHPELAQVKGEPQLPKYDTRKAIALIARPENNSRNTLHKRRVQFTSADSVTKSGIDVDVVQERSMSETISANGELMFDPSRVAHMSTRVPGTVAHVFKTLGEEVRSGDVLALINAAQVGQLKTQLLQSIVQYQLKKSNVDRLNGVASSGAISGKAMIEADSALQEANVNLIAARQALSNLGIDVPDQLELVDPKKASDDLRFLGVSDSVVSALPPGTKTANLIPIRASYDGVVVESDIVAGEYVDTTRSLFTLSDPRRLWLLLNVRQEDARWVGRGMPVEFKPDDGSAEVTGEVSWISPAIDEQTRTLKVRVTITNQEGTLRDRTFGTGQIVLRKESNAIVVPAESVQSTSDAQFVFVRDKDYFDETSPKFFHVRQVRVGAKVDRYVELLAGVLPGEVVATKGSAALMAQLLRSNLGAGCGCHEH